MHVIYGYRAEPGTHFAINRVCMRPLNKSMTFQIMTSLQTP
ncbi:hypothetical protein [Sulfolobus spindle-shaped virus]|nr:hypothetical protein [Sulfolobus spindle-shaped virus]